MGAGLFLLIICIGVLVLAGVPVVASAIGTGGREAKRELREAKAREKIATAALRQIANGDSMPVLTAGDALDRIESNYTKELN